MLKYELDPAFIKSVEDIDKLDLTTSSVEVNLIISELKQFRPWCFAFTNEARAISFNHFLVK